MPIKNNAGTRLPMPPRPWVALEPRLTNRGNCSDCGVPAITAANGTYKVCPKCWGLLWHHDPQAEARRLRKEQEQAARSLKAALDAGNVEVATELAQASLAGELGGKKE